MSFIITTSPIIENRTITEYLGPIISNEVLGVNVISDSIAGFSDFFGGSSGTYRGKLEDLKRTVLNDLRSQALRQGADAIVGFSIAFNEISGKGKQMFMATACKKQVFDQQFSEKLVSADFGKQLLHILIDKAVMRQRAAASLLGA